MLKVRPSSLFMLCGCISSSMASLMTHPCIWFQQKEVLCPVVSFGPGWCCVLLLLIHQFVLVIYVYCVI